MYIVDERVFKNISTAGGGATTLTIRDYQGLSSETKPTLTAANSGSTFYCVDTGDVYIWQSSAWYAQ